VVELLMLQHKVFQGFQKPLVILRPGFYIVKRFNQSNLKKLFMIPKLTNEYWFNSFKEFDLLFDRFEFILQNISLEFETGAFDASNQLARPYHTIRLIQRDLIHPGLHPSL
jgi:hypothetical protein